jgi:hypothetical protein
MFFLYDIQYDLTTTKTIYLQENIEACKLILECDDTNKDYVIGVLSTMLKVKYIISKYMCNTM